MRLYPKWSRVMAADLPLAYVRRSLANAFVSARRLLATLPARQRAALVLRYLDDLPDGDIAAALGCRTAMVRSLSSRGAAALRVSYARADVAADAAADAGATDSTDTDATTTLSSPGGPSYD